MLRNIQKKNCNYRNKNMDQYHNKNQMKNIEDYWKNGSKKKKVGDKKKSNISIKKRSWTIFESKELKKN